MKNDEPLPLWKEAIPDREPWRRGRVAVVSICLVVVAAQAIGLASASFGGDVTALFWWAIGGTFACLLLYLIWIGQNWARWIVAPFFGVAGFAALVWAVVYSDRGHVYAGGLFLGGLAAITMFAYLALSPAVYAFARRQRENASWLEIIGVGAGFLLVLGSIASASLAFSLYKSSLETEAMEFGQLAFRRVFQNHDAAFLEAHSRESRRFTRAGEFINLVDDQLGELQDVGPFGGTFRARLEGRRIALSGAVHVRARFANGGAWVDLHISGREGEWEIDQVSWRY